MYKSMLHNLLIVAVSSIIASSCGAPPPSGQQIVLADDVPNFRYTLVVTTRNASDESQTPRNGTLTIVTTNTATEQLHAITTTNQLTPDWLRPFGGQVSVATRNNQRWLIADDCRRDADALPLITIREVLGALPGFRTRDNQLLSENGAPVWQAWTASALPDATGVVYAATGRGTGKILIPGGEVIYGDISWDYQRIPAPTLAIPSQYCDEDVLITLPLPRNWRNRYMYGGALLVESPHPPARSATDLRDTLNTNGWLITAFDTRATPIVIQASATPNSIRVFFAPNPQNGSDVTIITITP